MGRRPARPEAKLAYLRYKRAEEDALARDWKTHASAYSFRSLAPSSAEQVRGLRVLQQEFDEVAMVRDAELREVARAVIAAAAGGRFDELARECVSFSGPDRVRLCRDRLQSLAKVLATAAALYDPTVGFTAISFGRPNHATGMVGHAVLSFGPAVVRPKNADDRFPDRHQVELWWSGQVMPDANGPVHAAPVVPDAPDGRWQFFDLVLPYSREPALLQ